MMITRQPTRLPYQSVLFEIGLVGDEHHGEFVAILDADDLSVHAQHFVETASDPYTCPVKCVCAFPPVRTNLPAQDAGHIMGVF